MCMLIRGVMIRILLDVESARELHHALNDGHPDLVTEDTRVIYLERP